jgi:xylan 1,4-beta-xylosidase
LRLAVRKNGAALPLSGTATMLCMVAVLFPGIGAAHAAARTPVSVQVNLQRSEGTFDPVYRWFGYDESGYTTTTNSQALLHQLHELTSAPVYVRAHFLLTSGSGKPELKWSSSNVYTEDANGKPVYNWTILDRIFDAWVHAGVHPMVELGFMPKALSSHPNPYHIPWPNKTGEAEGWTYPPKSYARWEELIHQLAAHMVARYGMKEVSTWYWEVWNEPDIFYWHGTEQQYFRLYDYAVAGVREAVPSAQVGGPATTGPMPGSRSAKYLEAFLRHCANDRSSATGGAIPLDFISFHAKGSPHFVDGHEQMGISQELKNAATGFAIIHASRKFRGLPVILSEADPEGCGACAPAQHPEDSYRNGTLYPAYTAEAMQSLTALAHRADVNLIGFLTWAFEFERQPIFIGQRDLATHGVDKPELNFFRMAGLLDSERVEAVSSGAIPAEDAMRDGVRQQSSVDAVATRGSGNAAILLWNYQDNAVPGPGAAVRLEVRGLPATAHRVLVQRYCIDRDHSNAYTAWRKMGSPLEPSSKQMKELKAAGQLQTKGSPRWLTVEDGHLAMKLNMPRESLDLLRVSWGTGQ